MRLIDADKLLERLPKVDFEHDERITMSGAIIDFSMLILDSDVVDAAPVMHGKWNGFTHSAFHGLDDYGEPIYRDCVTYTHRKCGFNSVIRHKYCPRCGAKMDLEELR